MLTIHIFLFIRKYQHPSLISIFLRLKQSQFSIDLCKERVIFFEWLSSDKKCVTFTLYSSFSYYSYKLSSEGNNILLITAHANLVSFSKNLNGLFLSRKLQFVTTVVNKERFQLHHGHSTVFIRKIIILVLLVRWLTLQRANHEWISSTDIVSVHFWFFFWKLKNHWRQFCQCFSQLSGIYSNK